MKNPNAQNQQQDPPYRPSFSFHFSIPGWLIGSVVAIIVIAALASFSKSFWYFEVIENDQVGVTIEAGEIQGVVQPGIAYDFGLFVNLVKITTSAVAITVDDPELITIDKQRIGLEVTADVFRPREADICLLYTSDAADERSSVDLGGRRIIKKKERKDIRQEWAKKKKEQ